MKAAARQAPRPGAAGGGTRRARGGALVVGLAAVGMLWGGAGVAAAEDAVPDLPPGPAVPIQDRIDFETRGVVMLKNFLPELKVRPLRQPRPGGASAQQAASPPRRRFRFPGPPRTCGASHPRAAPRADAGLPQAPAAGVGGGGEGHRGRVE